MSIWYDGTNLNMYRGDSGTLIFTGLPACTGYRVYFSVKSIKTGDIVFECSGEPEYYYIDNEGETIVKEEGETEEEFIRRCEEMVESGDAIKRGRSRIYVSSDKTEKLHVLKTANDNEYYYGLKICYASTGIENTLIPYTKYDEETGEIVFKDPPKLIVRPKYAEGILPFEDYDEIELIKENPKDYGIQPLLTPSENITIDVNGVIDLTRELKDNIDQISVNKDNIESLTSRVTINETDIEELVEAVADHDSRLNQDEETLDSHQLQLNSHSNKIASLEQTVGNYRSGLVKSVNDINDKMAHYGDIVTHNTNEFQATLTEGMGIKITNNEISVNLGIEQLNNVLIEDLQDGDILMYSQALGKWINRPLP